MNEDKPEKFCLVCGVLDSDKPMCFRGEDWCSDDHRKVIVDGESKTKYPEAFALMCEGVGIRFMGETPKSPEWVAWWNAQNPPIKCEPEELGSFSARSSLGRPW